MNRILTNRDGGQGFAHKGHRSSPCGATGQRAEGNDFMKKKATISLIFTLILAVGLLPCLMILTVWQYLLLMFAAWLAIFIAFEREDRQTGRTERNRKAAKAKWKQKEFQAGMVRLYDEVERRKLGKELNLQGPWEFSFVLTDEEKRKRILDFVKPYFNEQGRAGASDDYQNLNLAYGVTDKSGTVFVTLTYFMSDFIKRCDDYDDYSYIVLTGKTAFGVDWKDRGRSGCFEKIGPSNIGMPRWAEPFREIVGQALAFYEDLDEERAFEKKLKADDPQFYLSKLKYQVRHEALRPYYNNRPKA